MVSMTSPLWELVWITGRGLSLKHVGSDIDISENKESLFCNTESSNIVISPAQCPNNEQNKKSNSLVAESQTLLNPEVNHVSKNSPKLIVAGSPKSSPINSELPELISRSHGEVMPDCKMTGEIVHNRICSHDDINEKEAGSCSPRNVEGFNADIPFIDAVDVAEDKASLSGDDNNDRGAEFLACQEKGHHAEVAEAAYDNNHNGSMSGSKNHQKPSMPESNTADCNMSQNVKTVLSSSSTGHGCGGRGAAVGAEGKGIRTSSNFSIFEVLGLSNIKPSNVGKEIEIISALDPSPQVAGENEIPRANNIDDCLVIRSQSTDNVNTKNQHKVKEKIQCDKEGCGGTSNEKEDSNESVESSNSSKRISKGKRVLEFDSSTCIISKRFKMDGGEDSNSGSLVKRNRSFLHWMSTITNSASRHGQSLPSEFCEGPHRCMKENCVGFCRMNEKTGPFELFPIGFTSFFQSLYSSSSITKNLLDDGRQRELNDRKELKSFYPLIKGHQNFQRSSSLIKDKSDERKELDNIRNPSDHDSVNLFSGKDYKLKFEEPKWGNYQVVKYPSTKFDMITSSNAQNKVKGYSNQECTATKMVHPSSSTKNSITCSKESQNRMPIYVPNSSTDVALSTSRDFCENPWISRFFRKDSVHAVRALSCQFGREQEKEKQANKSSGVVSKTSDNHVGNDYSYAGPASINSHRLEVEPSKTPHQFKDSKARNCLFVTRLDYLRHIMTENESIELPPSTTINCILKGKNAHNKKGPSRIIGTISKDMQFGNDTNPNQQEELQQFIKSNDGNVTASFFPRVNCAGNAYLKSAHTNMNIARNSSSPDKNGWISIHDKPGSHYSCTHETKVAFLGNQRGERRMQNISDAHRKCNADKITAQVARNLHPSEECIGETMVLEKHLIPGWRRADAREHQMTTLCGLVANEISDERTEIFESIKRLRLSRTEMVRLLTSTNACKNLEGFFLRLRLGQWEKELGGTGYHVARINGANCEKTLSISTGKFTCIVESRFVSNHDFFEDELKAWWSTMLRNGEIPSREELCKKINERTKLGL